MVAFDEKSVPRKHPDATSRNVDGEEVVMVPHVGYVHVLNEAGAFFWSCLDGQRTVEEIARALTEEFEMEYATAREDLLELLKELEAKHMVISGQE
jgi:hypothetical protein